LNRRFYRTLANLVNMGEVSEWKRTAAKSWKALGWGNALRGIVKDREKTLRPRRSPALRAGAKDRRVD
jgi:hypothetical protein